MSKKKKTILAIVIPVVVIILILAGVGAYILFGIVGVEGKKEYKQSEIVQNNKGTNVTVIDETVSYQTMKGFGASGAWWAQEVGEWENSEEIISYLYDNKKGIGLNIYRYNLGAGSQDDENLHDVGKRAECFLLPDGSYDFSADHAAQNSLATAKKLAGDDLRVTLFANSPPVSLTKNGLAYGSARRDGEPLESNLDASNYGAYADYCYTAAEHFVNDGYRVTDVSPINEPQFEWSAWYNDDGTFSCNQEGCHYSEAEARDLMLAMVNKFSGSKLEAEAGVKVSMFESGAMEGENTTTSSYLDFMIGKGKKYVFKNKPLRDYFNNVSMHSYWSNEYGKITTSRLFADKYSNYSISATEYCQMYNDTHTGVYYLIQEEENGTNGMTIEYGVAMADIIMKDLTIVNVDEWDWWLGCSFGVYTDGLVYVNRDNHSDIQPSKRLWCLGNFSKFIDEGAIRYACSSGVDGISSCAFMNVDNSRVVVYVNNTKNDAATTLAVDNEYEIYTTSAQYDLEKTASGQSGDAQINLPAMSVVTVVY